MVIVDASWHRVPKDEFGTAPYGINDTGSDYEWEWEEEAELITLDLGTDRVARRALLGFNAPSTADFVSTSSNTAAAGGSGGGGSSWSTARSVRASRSNDNASKTSTTTLTNTSTAQPHLGAGKMFSLTGLDGETPVLKIENTVLKGKRVDMLGTEIVLMNHTDATKPRGSQHRLRPLSTPDGQHPTARSSTTRTRILFTPIYDPADNERLPEIRPHIAPDLREAVNAVKNTTTATNDAKRTRTEDEEEQETELPEEELLVRRAERSIKKAARALRKQQKLDHLHS